jgi:hypothetical protein
VIWTRTSSVQLIDASVWGDVIVAERSASVVGAGGAVTGGGVGAGVVPATGTVGPDPPQSGSRSATRMPMVARVALVRRRGAHAWSGANIGPILSSAAAVGLSQPLF